MIEEEIEVINETRVRYVHHKSTQDVAVSKNTTGRHFNNLNLASAATDTIVMEKLENSAVVSLRLLNINYRRITPLFFQDYSKVTKLEVGCPVSITWMFRYLPRFPSLQHVRFGRLAFEDREEDSTSTLNFHENPLVEIYEIGYNAELYNKLPAEDKRMIDVRITAAMQLGQAKFPNLKLCDITVPKSIESELENFIAKFPEIQKTGEKRARYADETVIFCNKPVNLRNHSSSSDSVVGVPVSNHNLGKRNSRSSSSGSSSSNANNNANSAHESRRSRSDFQLKKPKIEVNVDSEDIECLEDPTLNPDSTSGDGAVEQDLKPNLFRDPRTPRALRGRRSPSLLSGSEDGNVRNHSQASH